MYTVFLLSGQQNFLNGTLGPPSDIAVNLNTNTQTSMQRQQRFRGHDREMYGAPHHRVFSGWKKCPSKKQQISLEMDLLHIGATTVIKSAIDADVDPDVRRLLGRAREHSTAKTCVRTVRAPWVRVCVSLSAALTRP